MSIKGNILWTDKVDIINVGISECNFWPENLLYMCIFSFSLKSKILYFN